MTLAMIKGLSTSIALETFILSKQMVLKEAFKVAIGMSFISMSGMEAAMNITDVLLTDQAVTPFLTIFIISFFLYFGIIKA